MPLLQLSELEALSPIFKGEKGRARAQRLLRMLEFDKVEASYAALESYHGPEAAAKWLENQDVHYSVAGYEKLLALKDGPFITVCNHPIGTVDGIALIAILGQIRPDYKMLVNKILERIKPLGDNFIHVTPTGEERTSPTSVSLGGIRAALEHVREGHPLGLFPSGAVSDLKLGRRPVVQLPDGSTYREPRIRDREWPLAMMKFIQKAGVPVVPIRLFDGNSRFFYQLGLISWKVRLLRQPHEVLNKSGKTLRFAVGDMITPEQIAACASPEELRTLLRRAVYSLPEPEKQ